MGSGWELFVLLHTERTIESPEGTPHAHCMCQQQLLPSACGWCMASGREAGRGRTRRGGGQQRVCCNRATGTPHSPPPHFCTHKANTPRMMRGGQERRGEGAQPASASVEAAGERACAGAGQARPAAEPAARSAVVLPARRQLCSVRVCQGGVWVAPHPPQHNSSTPAQGGEGAAKRAACADACVCSTQSSLCIPWGCSRRTPLTLPGSPGGPKAQQHAAPALQQALVDWLLPAPARDARSKHLSCVPSGGRQPLLHPRAPPLPPTTTTTAPTQPNPPKPHKS